MGRVMGNWVFLLGSCSHASCSYSSSYLHVVPSSPAAPHTCSSSPPHTQTSTSAPPPKPALTPLTRPVQLLPTLSLVIRKNKCFEKLQPMSTFYCWPILGKGRVKPETEKLDLPGKETLSLVNVVGKIPLLGCLVIMGDVLEDPFYFYTTPSLS